MLKQRLRRAPLAAVCGLFAVLVLAPAAHATDAAVPPVKVDGNPKCEDYGMVAVAGKFDPVSSGTHGPVTLTKHDEFYVKWTSTIPVDWVIVKGGPNANIYKYPGGSLGDDWLHAPMNGSKPYGLSHVDFCAAPRTDIGVVKDGPADAYVGDDATYTFKVTNTGTVPLTDVTVQDDRCAPLTKVTGDTPFDPGETWTYTCTTKITDAMGDALLNTVEACGKNGATKVCDTDTHT